MKNKMIEQGFNDTDSTIQEITDFSQTRVENLEPRRKREEVLHSAQKMQSYYRYIQRFKGSDEKKKGQRKKFKQYAQGKREHNALTKKFKNMLRTRKGGKLNRTLIFQGSTDF